MIECEHPDEVNPKPAGKAESGPVTRERPVAAATASTSEAEDLVAPGSPRRDADFVEALARGLNVLASFGIEDHGEPRGRMTLSEVAKRTNLSRGTARRLLLTLRTLNYVDTDGRVFWLTPKVLSFSNAYLARLGLGDSARIVIKQLTEKLNESSSVGVLDGPDVIYVARVEVRRLYSSGLEVGTRLPAHCSSLGRVLLASLDPPRLDDQLARYELKALTPRTIIDPETLRKKLLEVRAQQFAIVDGELEIGIRSIAVPIVGRNGRTLAALNASTSTARVSLKELSETFLPALRQAAQDLSIILDW